MVVAQHVAGKLQGFAFCGVSPVGLSSNRLVGLSFKDDGVTVKCWQREQTSFRSTISSSGRRHCHANRYTVE